MDIFTILKANIRHQKGSFFSIFILMFMVSMLLTAVLTININAGKSEWDAVKHAGFGDILAALNSMDEKEAESLIQRTEENEHVEKVETAKVVYANIQDINGRTSDSGVMLEPFQPADFDFRIYDENGVDFLAEWEDLQPGEICVPISYTSMYDCKTGDKVVFKSQKGSLEYTVKYFFEDPFMGSSLMGIKTLLLNEKDLKALREAAENGTNELLASGTLLNVFQKDSSELSYLKFTQNLNKDTGLMGYAWISMGTEQAVGYMLLLTNIFSGIFLVFIVLLLIVTLIIMSHSISSSIEMEYVNLGILKAVGFPQGKLKLILVLQYLLGAVVGAVLGIPLAIPVIRIVNRIVIPVICIRISSLLALIPCVGAILGILVFMVLFIHLKLRKLKEITPVRAICGGRDSIYFSSRLEMPIRKGGLSIHLAFRQLTSNGKQYISVVLIASLLIFFLVMVSNANSWVGQGGKGISRIFEAMDRDLEVYYYNSQIKEEAEKEIKRYTDIEKQYRVRSQYLMIDGCQCYCYITDEPEEYSTILEGRTCRYDNEILITEFVARDLKLQIGDTVTVASGEDKAEYLISGIYQSANDMGANFGMNLEGYLRLRKDNGETIFMGDMYHLEDGSKAGEIAEKLNGLYGKEIQATEGGGSFNGGENVAVAVNGLSFLVYVLAVIFTLVVIFLVCGKVFAKERQDYGIYKAMGFTSRQLRLQFALRFVILSLAGSVLGVVLSVVLLNPCMEILLSFVGISQVEMELSLNSVVFPVLMMVVVFFVFSWLLAGRIRRVQPRILIVE